MRYIIDTHILLWLIFDPDKLSKKKLDILKNPMHEICITSISFWEISLKYNLGKLDIQGLLPDEFPQVAQKMGIKTIDIDERTMASFYKLKRIGKHRDPFDRIVIWYCISNNYTLVSQDGKFAQYNKYGLTTL